MLVIASACAPVAVTPSQSASTAETTSPPRASTSGLPSATPPTTVRPSANSITLPTGAAIAAARGGVAWMFVSFDRLFVSLNRGDTWTERALPPAPFSPYFAFISAGEGWWLIAPSSGTQCIFQSVEVWKTDDGAVTWRKLQAAGLDTTTCKGSIQFSGPGTGFIPVTDAACVPTIYRTVDGGRSWLPSSPLADPPGFRHSPGSPLQVGNIGDFGDVLFAEAFASVNGTVKPLVYRSTDRGATWTYAVPSLQSADIVFVTPTRWLQFVPQDTRETTDAGRTWHFYANDYQTAAPIAPQFVFGDASTGYATVRGTLARTTDGGAHWSSLKTPGT